MKAIKHIACDFECYQDAEKTRLLNPGYYIIWFYKAYDLCEGPKPEKVRLKISSNVNYSVKMIGDDKDFSVVKEIIAQGTRNYNKNKITKEEVFYEISNSFRSSGLAYRVVINPLGTCYQEWENDASQVENITLLPPFAGQKVFTFGVPPNSYGIVIGIQNDIYGSHWFNVKSKVKTYQCREGENPIPYNFREFDTFCTSDVNKIEPLYDFSTSTFDVLSKVGNYPVINHNDIWIEHLKKKYPMWMEGILDLKPVDNPSNLLNWIHWKKSNGFYIGQANFTTREGRGAFYFTDDETKWIGYWEKNMKGKYGKLYGKNNKLIYEGGYKDGRRHGKGVLYYTSGEKFDGEFVNGNREGKGVFYWADGSRWEGVFRENEMDGEGMFYDGDD
ncbi:MAG: hypothetical protein ACRC42_04735, partial [Mycoplasma sp.]